VNSVPGSDLSPSSIIATRICCGVLGIQIPGGNLAEFRRKERERDGEREARVLVFVASRKGRVVFELLEGKLCLVIAQLEREREREREDSGKGIS
jgi:hypothetical protein